MLIAYCEKCGIRVPEAPQDAPAGTVFCKTCAPALSVAQRPKGSGRQKPLTPESGVAGLSQENAASSPKPTAAPRATKSANAGVLIGAAGLTLGLVIGILVAFKPGAPPEAPKSIAAPNQVNVAVTPPIKPPVPFVPDPVLKKPDPAPVNKSAESPAPPAVNAPVVDAREDYAARRWAELKTRAAGLSEHAHWRLVDAFVKSQGSTKAGSEAAEWLKQTPMPPPPPPMPEKLPVAAGTVLNVTFDDDADLKLVKDGAKEVAEGIDGKGRSARSRSLDKQTGFIGTALTLDFGDRSVAITPETWLRFAYKSQQLSSMRIMGHFDDKQELIVLRQPEGDKWAWCTIRIAEFNRSVQGPGKPTLGSRLAMLTIHGGRSGDNSELLIDNLSIGNGQPGEAEKLPNTAVPGPAATQDLPPAGTQLNLAFEDDADIKSVKDGIKEPVEGFGGKGRGIKSRQTDKNSGLAATVLTLDLSDKAVTTTADSWLRFAYKQQQIVNMRVAVAFEDKSLNPNGVKWADTLVRVERDKWGWCTIKIADMSLHAGRGEVAKPAAGMRIKEVVIQGGRLGDDPLLVIDNFIIGAGQPPEPPKE